jgi:hypothetical protein
MRLSYIDDPNLIGITIKNADLGFSEFAIAKKKFLPDGSLQCYQFASIVNFTKLFPEVVEKYGKNVVILTTIHCEDIGGKECFYASPLFPSEFDLANQKVCLEVEPHNPIDDIGEFALLDEKAKEIHELLDSIIENNSKLFSMSLAEKLSKLNGFYSGLFYISKSDDYEETKRFKIEALATIVKDRQLPNDGPKFVETVCTNVVFYAVLNRQNKALVVVEDVDGPCYKFYLPFVEVLDSCLRRVSKNKSE